MKWMPVLAITLALSGCGQQQTNSPAAAAATAPTTPSSVHVAPPAPPPKPRATPEAWRAAFNSSFHTSGPIKDAGDGVAKFSVCFNPSAATKDNKCLTVDATKDGFRKLWIFTTPLSALMTLAANRPYVSSYVSVRENGDPKILLSAHYIGRSWLFMSSLAVMVDGDVVLEQHFGSSDVHTHVESGEVEESVDFILSDAQIAGLRKIVPGSKVLLRLTGKSAYASIDDSKSKKGAGNLFSAATTASDLRLTLAVYDAIAQQVKGKEVLDQP